MLEQIDVITDSDSFPLYIGDCKVYLRSLMRFRWGFVKLGRTSDIDIKPLTRTQKSLVSNKNKNKNTKNDSYTTTTTTNSKAKTSKKSSRYKSKRDRNRNRNRNKNRNVRNKDNDMKNALKDFDYQYAGWQVGNHKSRLTNDEMESKLGYFGANSDEGYSSGYQSKSNDEHVVLMNNNNNSNNNANVNIFRVGCAQYYPNMPDIPPNIIFLSPNVYQQQNNNEIKTDEDGFYDYYNNNNNNQNGGSGSVSGSDSENSNKIGFLSEEMDGENVIVTFHARQRFNCPRAKPAGSNIDNINGNNNSNNSESNNEIIDDDLGYCRVVMKLLFCDYIESANLIFLSQLDMLVFGLNFGDYCILEKVKFNTNCSIEPIRKVSLNNNNNNNNSNSNVNNNAGLPIVNGSLNNNNNTSNWEQLISVRLQEILMVSSAIRTQMLYHNNNNNNNKHNNNSSSNSGNPSGSGKNDYNECDILPSEYCHAYWNETRMVYSNKEFIKFIVETLIERSKDDPTTMKYLSNHSIIMIPSFDGSPKRYFQVFLHNIKQQQQQNKANRFKIVCNTKVIDVTTLRETDIEILESMKCYPVYMRMDNKDSDIVNTNTANVPLDETLIENILISIVSQFYLNGKQRELLQKGWFEQYNKHTRHRRVGIEHQQVTINPYIEYQDLNSGNVLNVLENGVTVVTGKKNKDKDKDRMNVKNENKIENVKRIINFDEYNVFNEYDVPLSSMACHILIYGLKNDVDIRFEYMAYICNTLHKNYINPISIIDVFCEKYCDLRIRNINELFDSIYLQSIELSPSIIILHNLDRLIASFNRNEMDGGSMNMKAMRSYQISSKIISFFEKINKYNNENCFEYDPITYITSNNINSIDSNDNNNNNNSNKTGLINGNLNKPGNNKQNGREEELDDEDSDSDENSDARTAGLKSCEMSNMVLVMASCDDPSNLDDNLLIGDMFKQSFCLNSEVSIKLRSKKQAKEKEKEKNNKNKNGKTSNFSNEMSRAQMQFENNVKYLYCLLCSYIRTDGNNFVESSRSGSIKALALDASYATSTSLSSDTTNTTTSRTDRTISTIDEVTNGIRTNNGDIENNNNNNNNRSTLVSYEDFRHLLMRHECNKWLKHCNYYDIQILNQQIVLKLFSNMNQFGDDDDDENDYSNGPLFSFDGNLKNGQRKKRKETITFVQRLDSIILELSKSFKPPSLRVASTSATSQSGNTSQNYENYESWDEIGGLTRVKEELLDIFEIPIKYHIIFDQLPMKPASGVLLYGPTGCGKTMIAHAIAKKCNFNLISVKGPELLNKYIGASEAAVRDVFLRAQQTSPCIIFFDEFEALACKRGSEHSGVTDRVVNQLLTFLDGVETRNNVFVIAASNRPDLIDVALLRPGRLEKKLFCDFPTIEDRLEILDIIVNKKKKVRINCDSTNDLKWIANECENFTGADIQNLFTVAQTIAFHRCKDLIDEKKKYKKEIKKNEKRRKNRSRRKGSKMESKSDDSESESESESGSDDSNDSDSYGDFGESGLIISKIDMMKALEQLKINVRASLSQQRKQGLTGRFKNEINVNEIGHRQAQM